MRILITGATGFIGSHLTRRLLAGGHEVVGLTRNVDRARQILPHGCQVYAWDPARELPSEESLTGVQGIVNLLGESVNEKRWNQEQKDKIRNSRILGTRDLILGIERMSRKPEVIVSGSAIGYYGDRGDEVITEESQIGSGFLSELCRDWEAEARSTPDRIGHARVVLLRTGVVLGLDGGALKIMLPVFRSGFGGPLGSGLQWISWIHIDDLVSLIVFALENSSVTGPINGTAPNPVRNKDYARILGKVIHRPALLRVPAFALKIGLGEMSEILLGGQKVLPQKALKLGFKYRFNEVEGALRDLLG